MNRPRPAGLVLAAGLAFLPTLAGPGFLPRVSARASASQSDDPQEVFRGGVETVAIYATALDRFGNMVLNLRQEDFEVLDDGRRQTLTVFRSGLLPITAALLIDASASMTLNLQLAREAAEQFVIRLFPSDRARVGTFSDRVDLSDAFISDRDELLRLLRANTHFGNRTKLWDALDLTMSALAPLGGRRVIMVLTDGADTASTARAARLLERGRQDETMVYVVQFRSSARGSQAELPLAQTPAQTFNDFRRDIAQSPLILRQLTTATGGGFFALNEYDDINTTFTHVMQELHYQYVLGFTPQRADGRLHDLRVRSSRTGVVVRARQSYLAPMAGATGDR